MPDIKRWVAEVKSKTNASALIASLSFLALGLALILIAKEMPDGSVLRSVFNTLGSFFVGTMIVAFVWELVARRNLLNEMRAEFGSSLLAREIGLDGFDVASQLLKDREIPSYCTSVDVLIGPYDERELKWHQTDQFKLLLQRVKAIGTARIRIVFPYPKSTTVKSAVSERLDLDRGDVEDALVKSVRKFVVMLERGIGDRERWALHCVGEPVFFSYARFDDDAVALFCKRAAGGEKAPRLRLRRQRYPQIPDGNPRDLFDFFQGEFTALFDKGGPFIE